ncbi:MAG: tyrosine-protein phosphatase [Dehalococcoidia bacterium]|nr:tyrosine-protein phosphatase [Dehalococcoidia bacterium]
MPNWVIENLLATSPRPGYSPGPEHSVPLSVVNDWVVVTRNFGIRSIMCLIDEDQLWLYRHSLPEGLVGRYKNEGFHVAHIPTLDHLTHPFTPEQYERAWQSFLELPKPVLVHCSAGMDRTGRIVNHLLANLQRLEVSSSGKA